MKKQSFGMLLLLASATQAADINSKVAAAYNDGIVRCSNPECAKYLYACFRAFASSPLQDFLGCGSQASRLNDDQKVVAIPQS